MVANPINIASLTPQEKSRIAFMRFGLGPKPGGPALVGMNATSAQIACLNELEDAAAANISPAGLPTFQEACDAAHDKQNSATLTDVIRINELNARYAKHLQPTVGFVERLVLFWSNHFSMNMQKSPLVRVAIGNMERTVIRQNVLGKFSDLLKGVMQHTSMIAYLDNDRSIGPNSVTGLKYNYTYNENLAREILELYTLGAEAGYTQVDVTNFAKILTGWRYNTTNVGDITKWGQFYFDASAHEPGAFTVFKQSFPQTGQAQGLAVLDYLARQAATAEHIAYKLLLHFVQDVPDPAMVKQLADVFIATDGNLKEVSRALLQMEGSWTAPMTRIRPPHLWLVAITRALSFTKANIVAQGRAYMAPLQYADNTPWTYITPDGFPDEDYAWMNPDAIRIRTGLADSVMRNSDNAPPKSSATLLAQQLFPGTMSAASMTAIANATQAATTATEYTPWTMLFMTPEFMRR